jgi:hypothetical protein
MGEIVMPHKTETAPEPLDIYLDVEHVWQQDPEHNIPENERRKICAIACMKMIIDYTLPEQSTVSLHSMYREMKASGAQNSDLNWKHADEVNYLKKLGLVAWRRNWNAPSQDPKYFADNEGYNIDQLVAVSDQISDEEYRESRGNLKGKFLFSLIKAFKSGMPVIVSVKANMSGYWENSENHQIVLNGYTNENGIDYLYYTDPILPPEKHQDRQKISVEDFFESSNFLAIFVAEAKK